MTDYWMICQRTGKKTRRSQMKQEWNGLWVREESWEPKHPQLDVRAVPDDPSVRPAFPAVRQTMGDAEILDFYDC